MKRKIIVFMLLPLLTLSCYKKRTSNETEKEENYYSLKITTNNPDATNYSVNVDNLNRIKEGTKVTISNTPGYYKIIQFLSSENELLSSDNTYSFEMNSDKEIKIVSQYSTRYFYESLPNKEANIILMAGQSNMEGYSPNFTQTLSNDVISEYRKGHNNVYINYNCFRLGNFTEDKHNSNSFVGVDFGQGLSRTQFGPEVGFSKYLGTNSPQTSYFLIKAAWGGTDLNTYWNPNNINNTGDKYMYSRFVMSVDKCLNMFTSYSIKPKIKGVIWMQGCSDCDNDTKANAYLNNFSNLVNTTKTRYSQYLSDDFKWVSGYITNLYNPRNTIINNALKQISDRVVEESETLERDVSENPNNPHYTSDGYLKLGEYFGREFLR